MAQDPWQFGWTQTLTLLGLIITIIIAVAGFRSFGRWKKERLEEKKIEIALDALAIAYESKSIFEHIRSPMAYSYEWKDMPKEAGETEQQWNRRGAYYATLTRVDQNRDFFERVFKLQPKCMAVFGPTAEEIFRLLHMARREVEVAAQMLARQTNDAEERADRKLTEQLRADIWDQGNFQPELNRVGQKLGEFREGIERLCRHVIDRQYGAKARPGLLRKIADRVGL